jgi:sphinganine C4-monooxygenase
MLGTVWTGGDVSSRYERARVSAQRQVEADSAKSTITHSGRAESPRQQDAPYKDELVEADLLSPTLQRSALPSIPAGKATQQAVASREQVLQDSPSAGGWSVLADEAEEERQVAKLDGNPRRSPRKIARSTSSAPSQTGSLKGLKERVSGSFQGRRGTGVLGMESSR